MESQKILFSLVVLAAFLSVAYCTTTTSSTTTKPKILQCVQCESTEMRGCYVEPMNDTVKKNFTRACDGAHMNVCMKVVALSRRTSWTGKNGMSEIATYKVSRFCAQAEYKNPTKSWCKSMDGASGAVTWCHCTEDGCNGGVHITISVVTLISCLLTKFFL